MTSPPPAGLRPGPGARRAGWPVAALVTFACILALQARFYALDTRAPRDAGRFHENLDRAWDAVHGLAPAGGLLVEPGGWYELLLAGALALFGRAPATVQALDLAWFAAVLVGVAALAAGFAEPPLPSPAAPAGAPPARGWAAGTGALALAGAMPGIVETSRTSWMHVVEAALLLGVVVPWVRDRRLERPATVGAMAVAGALAALLRGSGVGWLALVALFVLPGTPWRRALGLGLVWAVAAMPATLELGDYLAPKLAAAERYAKDVPTILPQLGLVVGGPTMVPLLLAIPGLGPAARRAGGERVAWLLGSWTAAGVALYAAFGAGIDNFTPMALAFAAAGGAGLASWEAPRAARLLPGFAVAWWAAMQAPTLLPPGHRPPPPWLGATFLAPDPLLYHRPWTGFGFADLAALVDATCADAEAGACRLAVDHGVLYPYAEDFGALELFLLDDERLDVVYLVTDPEPAEVDALASYACAGPREATWRERFPGTLERLRATVAAHELGPVWRTPVGPGCEFLWFTRHRELARPERLPGPAQGPPGHGPPPPPPPGPEGGRSGP